MVCDARLYEEAKAILIREQTVSISFLQRHLRLGYRAALRLMGELEKKGVVTAPNSAGLRAIAPKYFVVRRE